MTIFCPENANFIVLNNLEG